MSTANATHPVAPEEIMALLDGELPFERAQAVSVHTESCASCQQVFASLLRTANSLTSWTVSQVPDQAGPGVHTVAAAIGSSLPDRGPRGSLTMPHGSRSRWLVGLAACAAVLLLIVATTSRRDRSMQQSAAHTLDVTPLPVSNYSEAVNTELAEAAVPPAKPPVAAPRELNKLEVYAKIQQPTAKTVPMLPSGPMIARTVSLAILVKDFDASRKSLDAILVRYNGYAANLSVSTPQGTGRSLQASLRIPAPQLGPALAELKSLGHVENENQNGEEVTQQHADLVARLKNSRETEQRLQAILTQRTGKISDVLEVEQEIARVRGEIEQMEAEQKNLEHRVDFATIDLKLAEEYKAKLDSAAPSFSTEFHNALVNGYRNVADTLVALLLFFAEYGPILLFWALVLLVPAWLVWRRWRHVASPAM